MTSIDMTTLRKISAAPASKVSAVAHSVFPLGLEARILLIILALISLWALAIFTFGVPALVWPMKVIVPSMILGLVLLTWGM